MNDDDNLAIHKIEISIIDKFKEKLNEAGFSKELKCEYWEEKLKEFEQNKK